MTHTLAELQAAQAAGKRIEVHEYEGHWAAGHRLVFNLSLDRYRIVELSQQPPAPPPKPVPHKHAATIKAWADGAEIEYERDEGQWLPCLPFPGWYKDCVYRVKPEKKPDVALSGEMDSCGCCLSHQRYPSHNVVATFDGETGKLKEVSML